MKRVYELLKKVYYWGLDLLTKGRGVGVTINNFKVRLPAYYYRTFPIDYEKENFTFFKKVSKPGMTCIDIGAHIGLYSVFMSKSGPATVYSFEPTPSSVEVLRETVRVNKASDNVTVVPAAVSDKSGKATFYIDNSPISVANSLVNVDFGEKFVRKGYEVDVVSIDDFVLKNNLNVDFIKIDAEGVEVQVLEGARNTFLNNRPSGILGIHPFAYTNAQQTLERIWMLTNEYQLKVLDDGKPISQSEFCNRREIFDVQFMPAN